MIHIKPRGGRRPQSRSAQNRVAYGTDTFAARDFVRTGIVITVVGYLMVLLMGVTYWAWPG